MLDSTAPIPLDYQLPADAYYHLIRALRLTLPPPPTDSAEDLRKRDHAAIAEIAALAPGNSTEAKLAAQFVAASEQRLNPQPTRQYQPESDPAEFAVVMRGLDPRIRSRPRRLPGQLSANSSGGAAETFAR